MLSLDQIDKSDRVVIEREILVRRKLIGEMVGTLYPSILLGEIAILRESLTKHLRKEDEQNINISTMIRVSVRKEIVPQFLMFGGFMSSK